MAERKRKRLTVAHRAVLFAKNGAPHFSEPTMGITRESMESWMAFGYEMGWRAAKQHMRDQQRKEARHG